MAITVEQFIERLTESGLVSAVEISTFQDSLPPDKRPRDVQALAASLVKAGKLTKYQAQAVYQGKTKGLVFGEYVVLDKLGAGGMGVVLKARHRRMDRLVAIKVLSSSAMKQAGAVERFHREVKAAAKLSHPNIVTAHDAGEHQGMHYLAMEYVEGKDLAAIVKEHGPLGVREAVECTLQAARGLQYAHEQGIVHRDIKPGNLLLDKKGTVKILDMGLARLEAAASRDGSGGERLTQSGQVMGTCEYMAPEQGFDTRMADARSDIYSLGCTLYRLLIGQPPYQGETLVQILLAHQQAPIPSLCQARQDVPEQLDVIFQKMLAKEPRDRHQSMAEVVAELQAVLGVLSGRSVGAAATAESSSAALSKSLAFLQEDGPVGRLAKQPKTPAAEWTVPRMGQQDTGTNILRKVKRAVGAVRQRPLVLVGLVGGLLLLLGIILTLTLRHGTLAVEIDEDLGKDVQVAVSQGGEKVQVVDAKSGWTLSLSAGKYDLAVEGGDDQFQVDSESVTVTRGGQVKVKVTLKPAPPAVAPFDARQARKYQDRWARQLGVPVEITNSIGMNLVLIPPGEFQMGSPKELIEEELKAHGDDPAYKDYLPSEGPRHRVRITKLFYLGVYDVTQEEYQRVRGSNPSEFSATGKEKDKVVGQDTKRFPVEYVSWDDAVEFCRKLSNLPEEKVAWRTYRLPSDAQWEYACRAGSAGRFSFSSRRSGIPRESEEQELSDYGWFNGNAGGRTHAVGGKRASAWGLYDMHGNVWEWCQDWWDEGYYAKSPADDPVGPPAGLSRVNRGGSCSYPAWNCRSADRGYSRPGTRASELGFRVACEPSAAAQGGKAPAPSSLSPVAIAPSATPPAAGAAAPNTLTPAERAEGWQLLFDGRTTAGWRAAGSGDLDQVCAVDNGSLLLKGVRKYILSDRDFDNFELSLQWRVAPGGNSGILFHCVNDGPDLHQYSPEYQIVDNAAMTKAIELAGSVFALYAAPPEAVRAVGEWNDSRLVVEGKRVKHWLNGRKVVEYELGSPDFLARVARSSFQKDAFAQRSSGAIALQGWIGSAWFQNVKIRRLSPGSLVGADGKWKLSPGAPPPAIAPFDEKKAKEHQAAWAKHLGVPLEITNSMGMKLVLIPPGEFMMGSPKELIEEELGTHSEGWYTKYLPSEGPRHRVRITRAFWLGAYDVTQEEYERVMGANPSEFSASGNGKDKVAGRDTKHHPVEMVSWEDTTEFCVRLSNLPEEKAAGRRYRLPTEAQWEYACRAGTTTRWYCGDDEAALDECAWYHKNSGDMTQPVGQKRPNGWGLYDMHGNVWQWCADWHGADYYAKSSADDPSGPPEGSHHANRGGSWRHPPWQCRSAIRHDLPGSRHGSLGFRVSLVLADK